MMKGMVSVVFQTTEKTKTPNKENIDILSCVYIKQYYTVTKRKAIHKYLLKTASSTTHENINNVSNYGCSYDTKGTCYIC